MFSTFNIMRKQINRHEVATICRRDIANTNLASYSDRSERIAPRGNRTPSAPAINQSSRTSTSKQRTKTSTVLSRSRTTTAASEKRGHSCKHMAPALIYWVIATLFIVTGYTLAAIILVTPCVNTDKQRVLWLVYMDDSHSFIIAITGELCILSIYMFLVSLGHDTSALWLLLCGLWPPVARIESQWMVGMFGHGTPMTVLSGRFFMAAAAVALWVQGRTCVAGGLAVYNFLVLARFL